MKSPIKGLHIIDEVMGSFKTTAAIEFINKNPKRKFIVVTPYLSETERYAAACPRLRFQHPSEEKLGSKSRSLKELLSKRKNVVITHALLLEQKVDMKEYFKGYTIIIDEALEGVIKKFDDLHPMDVNHLFYDCIELDENLTAHWVGCPNYNGKLSEIKDICDSGRLKGFQIKNGEHISQDIFRVFPSELFEAFEEVFVLTYLFKGSVFSAYLRSEGVYFDRWYIAEERGKHVLTSDPQPRKATDYRPLIHFVHGCNGRFEIPGTDYYALSKNSYKNGETDTAQIKKILHSFFFDKLKDVTGKRMWTTFKDYKDIIANSEIASSFVECSAKASNEYRECTKLAYTVNRFITPNIKIYFSQFGVEFEENLWSLSQLLQWVWRSAIRDGNEIHLLIQSSRMRNMFIDWLGYCARDINYLRIKNADAIEPLKKSGFYFYREVAEKTFEKERKDFIKKHNFDSSKITFVSRGGAEICLQDMILAKRHDIADLPSLLLDEKAQIDPETGPQYLVTGDPYVTQRVSDVAVV